MHETANKALQSARELSLRPDDFRQVGQAQWQGVLKRVFETFASTGDSSVAWLWAHLKRRGASVVTDSGWKHIRSMVAPGTAVWILLEDDDHSKAHGNYWVFEGTYGGAIAVLGNMHSTEYYIVDRKFGWMVLENHHDELIGIGEPAEPFVLAIAAAQQAAARDRVKKRGA